MKKSRLNEVKDYQNFVTKFRRSIPKQYNQIELADDLMKYIIQYCQEREIEILMTSIASNNISAKIFYRNYNFETLGVEKHARKLGTRYIDEHWLVSDIKK